MGIDIYMRWDRMSKGNREAQYTGGFSIVNGHTGYLREAYHGGIYATRYLVHEAFEDDAPPEGVTIPTDILRRRLPETLRLHIQRQKETYGESVKESDPSAQTFTDFVVLAEYLEDAGKNPKIIASY